mmetsp:Transcript_31289/g.90984  ORF Transcript_31289/g.90984 Transcript_31289/m.90984 type:complete len:606 (-) Transcript_31289:596-2413(-)
MAHSMRRRISRLLPVHTRAARHAKCRQCAWAKVSPRGAGTEMRSGAETSCDGTHGTEGAPEPVAGVANRRESRCFTSCRRRLSVSEDLSSCMGRPRRSSGIDPGSSPMSWKAEASSTSRARCGQVARFTGIRFESSASHPSPRLWSTSRGTSGLTRAMATSWSSPGSKSAAPRQNTLWYSSSKVGTRRMAKVSAKVVRKSHTRIRVATWRSSSSSTGEEVTGSGGPEAAAPARGDNSPVAVAMEAMESGSGEEPAFLDPRGASASQCAWTMFRAVARKRWTSVSTCLRCALDSRSASRSFSFRSFVSSFACFLASTSSSLAFFLASISRDRWRFLASRSSSRCRFLLAFSSACMRCAWTRASSLAFFALSFCSHSCSLFSCSLALFSLRSFFCIRSSKKRYFSHLRTSGRPSMSCPIWALKNPTGGDLDRLAPAAVSPTACRSSTTVSWREVLVDSKLRTRRRSSFSSSSLPSRSPSETPSSPALPWPPTPSERDSACASASSLVIAPVTVFQSAPAHCKCLTALRHASRMDRPLKVRLESSRTVPGNSPLALAASLASAVAGDCRPWTCRGSTTKREPDAPPSTMVHRTSTSANPPQSTLVLQS